MSHPPDYPGRKRLKRAAARAGNEAYQGAFEAVGAVLVGCGFGFWIDGRLDSSPWGLIIGAVVGFGAMVLRLVRLGHELHPDPNAADGTAKSDSAGLHASWDDELGVGVSPGMSDVLREDAMKSDDATDETPRSKDPRKDTE